MLVRIPILTLLLLAIVGCSREEVVWTPLGGSFYKELTIVPDKIPIMEPGNNNRLRFIYKNANQIVEITRYLGSLDGSATKQFYYRIYGPTFVYVEREGGDYNKLRLRAFSPAHGNITIDENYESYWKVVDDEHGIVCHRLQSGQAIDDPKPVIYTSEYLSGL